MSSSTAQCSTPVSDGKRAAALVELGEDIPLTVPIPQPSFDDLELAGPQSPYSTNVTDQFEHLELRASAGTEMCQQLTGDDHHEKPIYFATSADNMPTTDTLTESKSVPIICDRPSMGSSERKCNINIGAIAAAPSTDITSETLPDITQKPKQKRKRSPSPPLPSSSSKSNLVESMTWQESEITGYDIDGSDDDGTGINGIGFKPTSAQAYNRYQKRKQQLQDWRLRVAREERQRRSERRRGMTDDAISIVQSTAPANPKRAVRFI